jgi:hypothetical protein
MCYTLHMYTNIHILYIHVTCVSCTTLQLTAVPQHVVIINLHYVITQRVICRVCNKLVLLYRITVLQYTREQP